MTMLIWLVGKLPGWWQALWPNLAANVLWIPVVAVHHRLLKRHLTRRLAEHHRALVGEVTAVDGTNRPGTGTDP